jgi:hypothetical protein
MKLKIPTIDLHKMKWSYTHYGVAHSAVRIGILTELKDNTIMD